MNNKQRTWLDNASSRGGSFIKTFAMACYAAGTSNFTLLTPVLNELMVRYPSYCETKEGKKYAS